MSILEAGRRPSAHFCQLPVSPRGGTGTCCLHGLWERGASDRTHTIRLPTPLGVCSPLCIPNTDWLLFAPVCLLLPTLIAATARPRARLQLLSSPLPLTTRPPRLPLPPSSALTRVFSCFCPLLHRPPAPARHPCPRLLLLLFKELRRRAHCPFCCPTCATRFEAHSHAGKQHDGKGGEVTNTRQCHQVAVAAGHLLARLPPQCQLG